MCSMWRVWWVRWVWWVLCVHALCMCACACAREGVHGCTCVHACVLVHVCICTCVHVCMHVCMCACACAHVCIGRRTKSCTTQGVGSTNITSIYSSPCDPGFNVDAAHVVQDSVLSDPLCFHGRREPPMLNQGCGGSAEGRPGGAGFCPLTALVRRACPR